MNTDTDTREFTVKVHAGSSDYDWEASGDDWQASGSCCWTRWGARWAARRAIRLHLKGDERWTVKMTRKP